MMLSHDVSGEGPVLVLLHSGVCDRRMWDAQWPVLIDADYRLVRCDFRGFGGTPVADRPYNDAEDVLELLDALGIGRVALVASSYGGTVALEFAARWPDRVSAMALLCSGLPGHEPTAERRSFNEREEALMEAGDITGAVELNVDTWLGPDADDDARDAVRQMQRHAFEVQLAATAEFEPITAEFDLSAIRAPCLALSGGHDMADFRQIAALLPGLLTDAHHVELPWAGHLPSLERPSAIADLLVGFLHEEVPVG